VTAVALISAVGKMFPLVFCIQGKVMMENYLVHCR
jgi:hypothetical protein